MTSLIIAGGCVFLVLALLWIERQTMIRARRAVSTRIVVMGTRGKTSVTRLIAAGLRAGGLRVLAKTTGSEPRLVLPDGGELPILRRGLTTPLEQRRVLLQAVRHQCDVAVIEAMSIRPESLRAELRQLICPDRVVVTNTYEDHVGDSGDPAAVFSEAIPDHASAFLPAEFPAEERKRLMQRNVSIRHHDENEAGYSLKDLPYLEWPQNLALALAVCAHVGVPLDLAMQGMARVQMDIGQLGAWTLREPESSAVWTMVNGFATNDPRSTWAALNASRRRWPMENPIVVGLLNLRQDRGDRTHQWMEELDCRSHEFDRMIVCGAVPRSVQQRLKCLYADRLAVVRSNEPCDIMRAACHLSPHGGYLFGFGNIKGAGMRVLKHWQQMGEPA